MSKNSTVVSVLHQIYGSFWAGPILFLVLGSLALAEADESDPYAESAERFARRLYLDTETEVARDYRNQMETVIVETKEAIEKEKGSGADVDYLSQLSHYLQAIRAEQARVDAEIRELQAAYSAAPEVEESKPKTCSPKDSEVKKLTEKVDSVLQALGAPQGTDSGWSDTLTALRFHSSDVQDQTLESIRRDLRDRAFMRFSMTELRGSLSFLGSGEQGDFEKMKIETHLVQLQWLEADLAKIDRRITGSMDTLKRAYRVMRALNQVHLSCASVSTLAKPEETQGSQNSGSERDVHSVKIAK